MDPSSRAGSDRLRRARADIENPRSLELRLPDAAVGQTSCVLLGRSSAELRLTIPLAEFPAHFRIDYVRVYQKKGQKNVGCDPKDYRA